MCVALCRLRRDRLGSATPLFHFYARCLAFPCRLLSWLFMTPVLVRLGDSSASLVSSVASFRSSSVASIAFSRGFPVPSAVANLVASSFPPFSFLRSLLLSFVLLLYLSPLLLLRWSQIRSLLRLPFLSLLLYTCLFFCRLVDSSLCRSFGLLSLCFCCRLVGRLLGCLVGRFLGHLIGHLLGSLFFSFLYFFFFFFRSVISFGDSSLCLFLFLVLFFLFFNYLVSSFGSFLRLSSALVFVFV